MVGRDGIGSLRALSLGLAAAALAACATTPAPIARGGSRQPAPPPLDYGAGPPEVVDYSARLQCVPFARQASGIDLYGDANTWWAQAVGRYPRSSLPAPGAVFVMRGYRDASRGHVAVVRHVESERLIYIDHANWLNGGEISVRVPVLDVSAANDWSEVRVWHVPGGHWGGRIYQAEGFIHPFALHASLG
ncbi:MAG: CHAP domain-containing protein [Hyphomonadaceae bacterium]